MRVALCLCGNVGGVSGQDGKGGWMHPDVGYQYLNNILLKHYDTDVFVHSWKKVDLMAQKYLMRSCLFTIQKNMK